MKRVSRMLAPILLAMLVWIVASGPGEGSVKTWRTSTFKGYLFSADRGSVTDSVIVFSSFTYDSVQSVVSGDTVGFITGAVLDTVVSTRRKWVTSSNGTIWGYPAKYTGSDTAGVGVACTYLGGDRNLWYMPAPDTSEAYNFFEVGGADSALAALQGIFIQGYLLPDSSVPTSAIEDYAITKAKVDTSQVATFGTARADTTIGKIRSPVYFQAGTTLQTDTVTTYSVTELTLDAPVNIPNSLEAQTATVSGNLYAGNIVQAVGDSVPFPEGYVSLGSSKNQGKLDLVSGSYALTLTAASLASSGTYQFPSPATAAGWPMISKTGGWQWSDAQGDTIVCVGDVRAEHNLKLGGNGHAGSMIFNDGSANTVTMTAAARASNITVLVPKIWAAGTVEYSDVTAAYHVGYYIAGAESTDIAIITPNECTATASLTIRPWYAMCKTDSLIVESNTSVSSSVTIGYLIWRP